jgi:hypothetical protein
MKLDIKHHKLIYSILLLELLILVSFIMVPNFINLYPSIDAIVTKYTDLYGPPTSINKTVSTYLLPKISYNLLWDKTVYNKYYIDMDVDKKIFGYNITHIYIDNGIFVISDSLFYHSKTYTTKIK